MLALVWASRGGGSTLAVYLSRGLLERAGGWVPSLLIAGMFLHSSHCVTKPGQGVRRCLA